MKTTINCLIAMTSVLLCALAPVSASAQGSQIADPFDLDFFDVWQSGILAIDGSASEQIADILAFFDDSVSAGTLQWAKEGKFPETMRNMIESAAQAIDQGNFRHACSLLKKIRNCFYFDNKPPQRISGPAMVQMVDMLTTLMQTLDCE